MPQNIGENVILENGIARINSQDAARLKRYLLRFGDIVYSRRGDVERRALVKEHQDGWLCGTGCLRVRPGNAADPRFLSYYLGHPEVRAWIVRHAVGATMPNLNTGILSALPTIVPGRDYQLAIAALLGALDDKIAVNDQVIHKSCSLAEAIYIRTQQRSSIVTTMGEVLELRYGKALPTVMRVDGPVPVYGSGGVSGFHTESLVSGPGIIVGRKGSVGAVYWSERDFFPIDTTFYVEPRRPGLPMEYAYFMLRAAGLSTMNSDSAVPGLNKGNALHLPIRIPSDAELAAFKALTRLLFVLSEQVSAESSTLRLLRDTLLPRLMSGEIRVREVGEIVENAT
jgi:type I restriction enzyme S subunit